MKGIKRSVSTYVSVFLLLCFSVTVVPIDLFHNHAETVTSCKDSKTQETCNHKYHVSVKSKFCWVCAIHFDKSFTNSSVVDKITVSSVSALLIESKVNSYFTKLIFSALRGPPTK